MTPWPGAYSWWQGERLRIVRAALAPAPPGAPGAIAGNNGDIIVRAANGGLRLIDLQPAGGRVMSIDAFVNGHPDFVGSQLGRDETAPA
jgi:methionyl-tRNA formyltransferase